MTAENKMSISLKTHKKLWGLAANRCAFKKCRKELSVDTFSTDDYYTIGDEAHIISGKPNGSRHDPSLPTDQLDKYDNLILLCKIHHKEIDSDTEYYPVGKVKEIKAKHIDWVRKSLGIDLQKQRDDELYADYIDQIEYLAGFDNWVDWAGMLLGGDFTKVEKQLYDNLVELHHYLKSRVYPKSNKELKRAIDQFNLVLEDLVNEFELYKRDDDFDKKYYETQQLYRLGAVTPEKQTLHEYLLQELVFELSKAGNYLCEQARQTIFPTYRLSEGILLLHDDPIAGLAYRRFEYKAREKYPGFVKVRDKLMKQLDMK